MTLNKLDKLHFDLLNEMTYLSKNIYNSALYEIKNYYNSTNSYLDYQKTWNIIKSTDNYIKLPSQVGQQTLKIADRNFKSFFALLRKKIKYSNYDNKLWKENSKMSKKVNQNFVQLPFGKLISYIEYKCKLNGINFKTNEESYTSKCDALALEQIKKQEVYSGKRIERGLFKSANNKVINSDVNGALNILRKVDKCKGESFVKKIAESGAVIVPIKIRLNELQQPFYKNLKFNILYISLN